MIQDRSRRRRPRDGSDLRTSRRSPGLLVLSGNLLVVVPWRDRRGREPVQPGIVIAASVAGAIVLDVARGVGRADAILVGPGGPRWARHDRGGVRSPWRARSCSCVRSDGAAGSGGWRPPGARLRSSASASLAAHRTTDPDTLRLVGRATAGTTGLTRRDAARVRRDRAPAASRRACGATSDRATEVMEGRAEIASIVAHDVRGPAGTIRSVAGSLRTSYQRLGDAERLEFVGMIEQESLRLLRVADQMSLGPQDRRRHAGVHLRRCATSRGRSCRDCTRPRSGSARFASRCGRPSLRASSGRPVARRGRPPGPRQRDEVLPRRHADRPRVPRATAARP